MNELDENEELSDIDDIMDIDITARKGVNDNPKTNPFMGIEDKLNLPHGSTKDGIKAAKAEVKKIADEAKGLKTQTAILHGKEKLADMELVEAFDMDTLAQDRRVLRKNYQDLFARGMAILNRLENDLNDLVNPTPEDYGAYQKQYLAMLKTLDSIKSALVTLRQEEEADRAKRAQAGTGESSVAAVDADGVPVPGAPANAGAIEVSPMDTNSWIAKWTAELDAEIADEIENEFNDRVKAAAEAADEPESLLPPPEK